jgi:hypothetical protein
LNDARAAARRVGMRTVSGAMAWRMLAVLLVGAAGVPPAVGAVQSTVYTHSEGGFPCIRIPSTLALPFDVMLSFAAARSWTGDVRQVLFHLAFKRWVAWVGPQDLHT